MENECGNTKASRGFRFRPSRESLGQLPSPGAALHRACPDLQDLVPREENGMEKNGTRSHFKFVQGVSNRQQWTLP